MRTALRRIVTFPACRRGTWVALGAWVLILGALLPRASAVPAVVMVAVGVLLDTVLVRSVLVPARVRDLGERTWWPSAPGRRKAD